MQRLITGVLAAGMGLSALSVPNARAQGPAKGGVTYESLKAEMIAAQNKRRDDYLKMQKAARSFAGSIWLIWNPGPCRAAESPPVRLLRPVM